MSAFGLRVVNPETGTPIGVGRALLRTLILGLGTLPLFGLGTAVLAWTAVEDRSRERRGWHDYKARSIVVDVRPVEVSAAVAEDERPRHVVNLTAMRLMPVRQAPTPAAPVVPAPSVRAAPPPRDARRPPAGPARPRRPVAVAGRPARAGPPYPGAPQRAPTGRTSGGPPADPGAPAARVPASRCHPGGRPDRGASRSGGRRHRDRRSSPQARRRPRPRRRPAGLGQAATPRRTTWRVAFDSGESFVVEGLGLVGRRPEGRAGEPVRHVVPLVSENMSISKTHAQFHLAGDGALVVMDRGSTNGSILVRRGVSRELSAGRPATLLDGDRVLFGDREMRVARDQA